MKAILVATLVATLAIAASATRVQCPDKNGEDVVLLPNPQDCTTYYSCDNGIPYLMKCNEGLHFNAEQRVCDWPEQARCVPSADLPADNGNDGNDGDDNDIQYADEEKPSLGASISDSNRL